VGGFSLWAIGSLARSLRHPAIEPTAPRVSLSRRPGSRFRAYVRWRRSPWSKTPHFVLIPSTATSAGGVGELRSPRSSCVRLSSLRVFAAPGSGRHRAAASIKQIASPCGCDSLLRHFSVPAWSGIRLRTAPPHTDATSCASPRRRLAPPNSANSNPAWAASCAQAGPWRELSCPFLRRNGQPVGYRRKRASLPVHRVCKLIKEHSR